MGETKQKDIDPRNIKFVYELQQCLTRQAALWI